MKHFINILVILILTGFAIGIAWLDISSKNENNAWSILFVPLIVMMILWGYKLRKDYE